MRSLNEKVLKNEEGQSLVEFALVLPLLLWILMGIIDLGRVFHASIVLQESARDAVRYASVGWSDQQITQVIASDTTTIDGSQLKVQITPSQGSRSTGNPVIIQMSYPVELITPLLSQILPNPVVVGAKMTMRME